MILYRSNRLEALLESLVAGLQYEPPPPLTSECVVVQSRGMATWLGQNLARRFRVWANPDFPHPRRFIQRLLQAALGQEAATAASFSREMLSLAILEMLPQLVEEDDFAPLRRYLDGADDRKALQLAERIAYIFDQYLVYRPEMVLAWEEQRAEPTPPEQRWQALLWQQLAAMHGSPASLFKQALDGLRKGAVQMPELLPPRVFLFGITTLPPIYLELINEAAKLLPCHLLLFSPAADYWADIRAPKEVNRLRLRYHGPGQAELHLETGHPLLASLGVVGREFQEIIEEKTQYQQPEGGDCFVDPAGEKGSMLARLQSDILQLRLPGGNTQPVAADSSVLIHACHSPLREVEILQDQLLAMLDRQGLAPRDIVVMVPDIETYAPLIEAVFRRPPSDPRHIPFRIADRKISREAPLLDALLALFDLAGSRLPLSAVLDFLSRAPVRQGLGLDGRQLRRIEQWLEQGMVRWGIDEEHRQAHGQPPNRQNTWRFGLDRLILGYALPGEDRHLLAGILPLDDIEGQDAQLAGVLLRFASSLFALADEVERAKTLPRWAEVVRRALNTFFAPEERAPAGEAWQRQNLRDALATLLQESSRAGLERPLALPAFLRLLRARLDEAGVSAGFLEGGLTFCTMLPMRTIPFPVVCLLGLNDGAFPRQDNPAGFDLLAAQPRPGDRSRRRDDRYLFLESLLSARRRLYLSYVGRDIKDNSPLPPSALVDEVLDCLSLMTGARRDDLVLQHPLQPFSHRYFQPEQPGQLEQPEHLELFTYAAEYTPGQFVPGQSPSSTATAVSDQYSAGVGPAALSVTLGELHRFFANPAKWYARNHLGLILPPGEEARPDREPIFLEGLANYRLNRLLLRRPAELVSRPAAQISPAAGSVAACDIAPAEPSPPLTPPPSAEEQLARLLSARGELPLAAAARVALAENIAAIEPLAAFLAGEPGGAPLPDLALDLPLADHLHLGGELRQRVQAGLLRWTAGRNKPSFYLLAWLDHLSLCALAPGDQQRRAIMVGLEKAGKATVNLFREVEPERAKGLLAELAGLWRRGREEPLPFFPASSYAWCKKINGAGAAADPRQLRRQAREAALVAYHGSEFNRGEGIDPYFGLIFQEAQPAGQWREHDERGPGGCDWDDFAAVAETVYGPMLQALAKPKPEEL